MHGFFGLQGIFPKGESGDFLHVDLSNIISTIVGLIIAYFTFNLNGKKNKLDTKKNDQDYIKEQNDRLNNENEKLTRENDRLRKEIEKNEKDDRNDSK